MQTVNDSKLQELGKQFPWLLVWFHDMQTEHDTTVVNEVRVERTDLQLCQRTAKRRETIGIFDQEGVLIGTVGWQGKKESWLVSLMNFSLTRLNAWNWNETVEEAILRLEGQGKKPHFLASYKNYRHDHLNNRLAGSVIVFKPKGPSLPEWLKSLRDGQAEDLKKTLTVIG